MGDALVFVVFGLVLLFLAAYLSSGSCPNDYVRVGDVCAIRLK